MTRIYLPSSGPDEWQRFLAQPELHWRTGYSARTLAHSWEAAANLPPEIERLLEPHVGKVRLLFAFPEHKTAVPGGRRDSQSDVFALMRHDHGLLACTVEGKLDEPFGETLETWCAQMTSGKQERLDYLLGRLGLASCPRDIHYQLLHRTAAALIEADRFHTETAAMIVHSFSSDRRWLDAFERFTALFGLGLGTDQSGSVGLPDGRKLVLGWACGDLAFLKR